MRSASPRSRLRELLTLGAVLQVLGISHQASRSQKLSLKPKKAAAQLAVGTHVGAHTSTGCFFWEPDCVMSEVMCGADNMIHADIKENRCKRFIYFFNHANDHCSIDEKRLENYRECFWTELEIHMPDRSRCGDVCADSHGHLPSDIEICNQQCVHVHGCIDECNVDKYKFRDPIMECFGTCMQMSPVNPVGTCQGSCGTHAPNNKCHCDPTCSYTDDCCDDYQNFCLVGGLRWNESLPLPNKSFTLPAYNVSVNDIDHFDEKHVPVAENVDIDAELEERLKAKLRREREAGRIKVSNQGHDHEEDKFCFPEQAEVQTPQGAMRMSELRVGDTIRAVDGNGHVFWDEVYFFGHADEASTGTYMQIELAGLDSPTLQLSQKHFLPGCQRAVRCTWSEHLEKYARDFRQGDYIWIAPREQSQLEQRQIVKISSVVAKGLYNPYTLSGIIVVNGVVASAHSNWILDDLVPASWVEMLPAIYQGMFLPGRVLYHLLCLGGPVALETVVNFLDVNSPQAAPEKNGRGPEFLLGSVFFSVVLATKVAQVIKNF